MFAELVVVSLLLGCACDAPPGVPAESERSVRLERLVENYFEAYLQLNPVAATFIGDHRHDDRLPRHDAEQAAAAHALEQRFLDELRRLDRTALSPADQLTYDLFDYGRRIALDGAIYPAHLLPLDQFNNAAAFFAQMGSGDTVQPFATVRDYDNFAGRMAQFRAWSDQVIGAMREGMRRGVVQPRIVAERMLPQLAAHVVPRVEDSLFWRPIGRMPAGIGAADHSRISARYRQLIEHDIVPAYRRLHEFVRDEYLPAARTSTGWDALPDGRAWYAYLARAYTSTSQSPAEIHAAGEREVARIEAEISRTMQRIGFTGSVGELAAMMREDKRFHFEQPGQLLDAYRGQQQRVAATVPRLFSLLPRSALDIRPMEPFREQTAAGAEYYAPTPDGSRPGIFYVNTYDLPARPNYEVETIFLHEAIPGHHFQIALTVENTGLPRFRRFSSDDGFSGTPDPTTAFVEGWGLYAESLGEELGFYTDPYQKLGNLFAESWRAARLVVDTGLHALGWSREQAIDYMLAHTAAGRTDAVAEVERYIAWPGQALAYKSGEMTLRRLRADAERRLGAGFDVRSFHAAVLEDGPLPLAVLERKIDHWIRNRAQ